MPEYRVRREFRAFRNPENRGGEDVADRGSARGEEGRSPTQEPTATLLLWTVAEMAEGDSTDEGLGGSRSNGASSNKYFHFRRDRDQWILFFFLIRRGVDVGWPSWLALPPGRFGWHARQSRLAPSICGSPAVVVHEHF